MSVRADAARKPVSFVARKLKIPFIALLIHIAAEAMTKNTVTCKLTENKRTIY